MASATALAPNVAASVASRFAGAALPLAMLGAILVLIVPVPAAVLDLLIVANITLAVLVLLTTIAIGAPQQFSAFPTLLLASALFRLVLNVASTRLILSHGGEEGVDAAGGVIRAFGEFVAGSQDQVFVGAILFLILVIIQFVVITKGATRIGEVAARFMLDGLPGRQMAIDADLQAGVIDQHEAQRRREGVYRQADFFAAMDGAGKFVRGDAVAGLLIAGINIVAGLALGIFRHGMGPAEAAEVFTKLTIGDGLVSQVPAFLTALAAGLIVTRSTSETDLGRDVAGQLLGRSGVLFSAAALLALLALTPLPKLPLLALAGGLAAAGWSLRTREAAAIVKEAESAAAEPEPAPVAPAPAPTSRIEDQLSLDPLEIEIGYRLIPLTDPSRGGDLMERMAQARERIARNLGLIVPPVRVRDAIGVGPHEYRIKLRGSVVGQGTVFPERLLAVPPHDYAEGIGGRDGIDPITGLPAIWIHAEGLEIAELAGCAVREAPAVLAGHFEELAVQHADELLSFDQCAQLLDRARVSAAGLVEEVVPGLLRPGEFRRVLQGLVRERVSIRDVELILEALAEHAAKTKDVSVLVEDVRRALGRSIVQPYRSADGRLRVASISKALEKRVLDGLTPEGARGVARAIMHAGFALAESGSSPVLLCSAEARPAIRDLLRARELGRLAVLSAAEVPRDVPVEVVRNVVEQQVPVVSTLSTTNLGS